MVKSIRKWIKQRQNVRRVKKSVRKRTKASKKRFVAHSKRVAVQYRIKRIRKWDGKKYYLTEFTTNREKAEKIRLSERAAGTPARCAWVNNGYAVYVKRED